MALLFKTDSFIRLGVDATSAVSDSRLSFNQLITSFYRGRAKVSQTEGFASGIVTSWLYRGP